MVLDELDKYNDLKDKTHTNQSGLSEQEKNKLIEEGKAQALTDIQKKKKYKKYVLNCCSNVFEYEPPPSYEQC